MHSHPLQFPDGFSQQVHAALTHMFETEPVLGHLDPTVYHPTVLNNKAIYCTKKRTVQRKKFQYVTNKALFILFHKERLLHLYGFAELSTTGNNRKVRYTVWKDMLWPVARFYPRPAWKKVA